MDRGKVKYLVLLHIVLIVYSLGGICSKLAAKQEFFSGKFLLYYGVVLAILVMYAIVWQQILKKLPLITAYANKAITIIWGILWGYLFFDEDITLRGCIASVVIIIGIYMVVSDGEEKEE